MFRSCISVQKITDFIAESCLASFKIVSKCTRYGSLEVDCKVTQSEIPDLCSNLAFRILAIKGSLTSFSVFYCNPKKSRRPKTRPKKALMNPCCQYIFRPKKITRSPPSLKYVEWGSQNIIKMPFPLKSPSLTLWLFHDRPCMLGC